MPANKPLTGWAGAADARRRTGNGRPQWMQRLPRLMPKLV